VNLNNYLNIKTDSNTKPWLGAVVEDSPLVSAIWDELRNDDRIDLLDNIQIKSIETPSYSDMGKIEPPSPVHIMCTQNNESVALSADLLVAADGANSFVRKCVGNFPMINRSYGRKAVTCTVELDKSKENMARTAFQRFLPYGPIALLPVWNSADDTVEGGPTYANVVWSTTPSEANHLLSLSPSEFVSTLNHHLCQGPNVNPSLLPNRTSENESFFASAAKEMDSLLRTANTALTMGTWTESPSRNFFRMPPRSVNVVSPILGFDLTLSHVSSSSVNGSRRGGYTSPRVALVGDAAHTMHPMAGQGLNLGMGDVHTLANLVKEAIDSGMDVGGTDLFLDRYNDDRMVKGWGTVGGVHSLHEVFGRSGSLPASVIDNKSDGHTRSVGGIQSLIGYSRSMGMNIINGIGPVRRALAEIAAGAVPRGIP
jgi:ubiquinone biosynthesis monooxygenase Coq6